MSRSASIHCLTPNLAPLCQYLSHALLDLTFQPFLFILYCFVSAYFNVASLPDTQPNMHLIENLSIMTHSEFAPLLGQHLPKQLGIEPWQLSSVMPAHRSAAPVVFICHFSSTELLGSGSLHPVISCAFVTD